MAIYDLKCKTCEHEFEFFKLKTDERPECEKCGEKDETKFEQKVSKETSFQLKGGGWAKDKYE